MHKKFDPSEMFKILGVETRIKIIDLLRSKGPLGANRIAMIIGISPAAVSQHLKILRSAGLVRSERKGYFIPYSLNESAMENCCHALTEICTCGCPETSKIQKEELRKKNLESLKNYEADLIRSLEAVRSRIKEIKQQTK